LRCALVRGGVSSALFPYTTLFRSSLEVPVRGGGAAFPGLEDVRVHPEAHRAPRFPPVEPGLAEDPVEPFRFGLALHPGGAGHHQDRKSTRLNSSHVKISYAAFCLK